MYECYYTRNFAAVKKKIRLHAQTHTNSYATLSETCPKLLKAPFVCSGCKSKLFFCGPMQSSQKPYIEKNHTLFRDIIPKGSSFDAFSQDTVDLIFSHVHSVRRPVFNNRTPYEMMAFLYSEALLGLFGIHEVAAHKVIQTPKLQKTADFKRTLV